MNKEVSLKELCALVWRAKIFVFIGLVLGLIGSFIFINYAVPTYRSVMIVAPADGYALGDVDIKTPEELAVYLNRNVRIDPLGATPLRKIKYDHPDQEFASAMLRKLHLVADQMIRRDRRRQSQSRIEYLENMLQKTINPDHRKGITNLLMQQEHIQMLANLNEAYAAIMVEPASSSPKPTWPNKPMSYLIGALIGMMLGFMLWSAVRAKDD